MRPSAWRFTKWLALCWRVWPEFYASVLFTQSEVPKYTNFFTRNSCKIFFSFPFFIPEGVKKQSKRPRDFPPQFLCLLQFLSRFSKFCVLAITWKNHVIKRDVLYRRVRRLTGRLITLHYLTTELWGGCVHSCRGIARGCDSRGKVFTHNYLQLPMITCKYPQVPALTCTRACMTGLLAFSCVCFKLLKA